MRPDPRFTVMFKVGDDLRHDLLTLQLVRIMDNIRFWQGEPMDRVQHRYEDGVRFSLVHPIPH